ncbi:MAG: amidohydrolase family protein [Hyphomicrobiales bacterium]
MIPLIDTHQHLVYADALPYGWTSGIPVLAGQSFTLEDYKSLTAGHGVERTLFMEAAVDDERWAEEAPFIANIAKQSDSGIAGLIATIRPESDEGFDAELEKAGERGIVGFRRILHVVDDAMSQSSTFRTNVRKIGAAGKVFDMCFLARQLPIARELAKACDNTTLVLDHCGVPDIAGGGLDPWRADMTALAELPNVSCKLSGILAYCNPEAANLESIRPYVDHVLEAFGPDRMVWGSDWPVVNMTSDLPSWLSITQEILAKLSAQEANAIGSQNASRLYSLDA